MVARVATPQTDVKHLWRKSVVYLEATLYPLSLLKNGRDIMPTPE
jgi:hypothetical protein